MYKRMKCIIITKKTQNGKLLVIDIGWAFGHRDTKTLIQMYDNMGYKEIPHVYADMYESYKEFFPHDKLTQSKRYTSAIERIKDIGLRRFVDALL